MTKISIIGAGNIGRALAYTIFNFKQIATELVLCDIVDGLPQGTALDIAQAGCIFGNKINFFGTNDYKDIENSDVVIISAGMPRKPGMTREDLININLKIIKDISGNIKKYAPDAFIIILTNPLDVIVRAAYEYLGIKKEKIVGMAGVLDSARFSYQISKILNIAPDSISPMVIGAHNDEMVPLLRHTTISGIPLSEFISSGVLKQSDVDTIIEKVKTGGAEIVGLLKTGSAYHAPACAAIKMAECYIKNSKKILSCSTMLSGQYGVNGMFVGAPVILGGNGVEKVLELQLSHEEKMLFEKSVDSIKKLLENIKF